MLPACVYTSKLTSMDVGWAHGAQHMWRSHGVSVEHAMEAIHDVDALLYDPDPKSKSAKSARLLGYSSSRNSVVVIILVRRDDRPGAWWGATGWVANTADTNLYWKENQR